MTTTAADLIDASAEYHDPLFYFSQCGFAHFEGADYTAVRIRDQSGEPITKAHWVRADLADQMADTWYTLETETIAEARKRMRQFVWSAKRMGGYMQSGVHKRSACSYVVM